MSFRSVIDCIGLYPESIAPRPLLSLHEFYKATFNDQLVINQPPWFHFFSLLELVYQLPVAIWAVWALKNKSPKAPAHLLVWATVAFGTTMTCLFEFYHNAVMSTQEKTSLIAMYGCYGLICEFFTPQKGLLETESCSSWCYSCRHVLSYSNDDGCCCQTLSNTKNPLINVH